MATKKANAKQSRKKATAKPTVGKQPAEAIAAKPHAKTAKHPEARVPVIGERVTIGSSEVIYNVSRVGGTDVDLRRPGTNLERFRVPVENLKFIDAPAQADFASKSTRPKFNVGEILERLETLQQSTMQELSGDIAVFKKYLKINGVDTEAADELDKLYKDTEKRWGEAVDTISGLLEEE